MPPKRIEGVAVLTVIRFVAMSSCDEDMYVMLCDPNTFRSVSTVSEPLTVKLPVTLRLDYLFSSINKY